jgi:hypothetical protein
MGRRGASGPAPRGGVLQAMVGEGAHEGGLFELATQVGKKYSSRGVSKYLNTQSHSYSLFRLSEVVGLDGLHILREVPFIAPPFLLPKN